MGFQIVRPALDSAPYILNAGTCSSGYIGLLPHIYFCVVLIPLLHTHLYINDSNSAD